MSEPTVINVCYSLPRFITMGLQCTFCAYMWELYTAEFGWTQAEYGIVSFLYSATQVVAYILLGVIFNFGINNLPDANDKKLNWSKGILAGGTFFHWLTYLLLIILPIRWHGVKTPYVDSIFGSSSKFLKAMFKGPVPLSSMAGSRFWWIIFGFPWCFVKLFWVILYIPMKVCFLCGICLMRFFRIMFYRRTKITSILPVLETLESIPQPSCSACCNTTCCNALLMRLISWKRWLRTRRGFICLLTIAHGIGTSAHEISNGAIRNYIYIDGGIAKGALNTNLTFFFISNLFVYFIFSLLKYFVRAKAFFADTFYLLTILFFVLMIPAIIGFLVGTNKVDAASSEGIDWPNACLWFKFLSATTFHSTVVFLIFSSGPLTFYLGVFILDGNVGIGSFGLLIINLAMTIASWAQIYGGLATFDPKKQMILTGICIGCGFFAFMLLYPQNWRWNIWHWFNYLIMIAIGVVNSVFVSYANIMQVSVATEARGKNLQWIFFGLFYSLTNAVVSPSMKRMFDTFGQNRQAGFRVSCIQIILDYCFPGFYKAILMLFIVANGIALYIYCTCHYLDWDSAVLAKFGDSADLKAKAAVFVAAFATGNTATQDQKVQAFKDAVAALKSAADKLKDYAELIHYLSQHSEFCSKLLAKTTQLDSAKTAFANADKDDSSNNNFKYVTQQLGNSSSGKFSTDTTWSSNTSNPVDFSNVGFNGVDFASITFTSANCDTLKTKAQEFKTKAGHFATEAGDQAGKFYNKAQTAKSVDPNGLGDTPDKFQAAANIFADGTKQLYLALRDIPLLS